MMVAGPRRASATGGGRRRATRHEDLGGEGEDGDVQEGRQLTLNSVVPTARPERERAGGEARKTAAVVPEKREKTASIRGSRLRFLLAEGRRRRGEDAGVLGWSRGASGRRRCGGGARLGRGMAERRLGFAAGEEKEGEREQDVAEELLILQRGARREGGSEGRPRRRRSWRQCSHCRHS